MLNDLLAKNGSGGDKLYVEDVFSTWLYTGTGASQTITNGIDLAGKGGLVWIKSRSAAANNVLVDTVRGAYASLSSNLTSQSRGANTVTNFNSTGFTVTNDTSDATFMNTTGVSGTTYASWTFREAPKFFDVVTWSGNSTNRTISHSLGSVPGMIIVKRTDSAADWQVYHRSLANTEYAVLNTTAAKATGATRWNSTTATDTVFSLGTDSTVNATGGSYVAYIFAHDTTADGVIQCGSFTTDASGNASVTLGYEPQFLLIKSTSAAATNWFLFDTMRGMPVSTTVSSTPLYPNLSNAEGAGYPFQLSATGFSISSAGLSRDYVYLAIRRGPMRVPTDATKVFNPYYRAGSAGSTIQIPSTALSYPPDTYLGFVAYSGSTYPRYFVSRLADQWSLQSDSADAEQFGPSNPLVTISGFQGKVRVGAAGVVNSSGTEIVDMYLRRSPSFFDTVYYSGTGVARTVSHNLGVAPELMIVKNRTTAGRDWTVYTAATSSTDFLVLNTTAAKATSSIRWNDTAPTASVFTVSTSQTVNASGENYVAYLFASCPGVSKVGSYTGTGTTQQINCGFTAGARFVLIKRTDTTGNWCFWNTATGISASSDPFMRINQNAQILTGNDWVDPYSPGFELSSTAGAEVNASGGTYIYLAIA